MNLNEEFDLIFLFNSATNQNLRFQMEARLSELGITAERFPVINGDSINPRYIPKRESDIRWQYARCLTFRLAIRKARRRGAKSVLLLEDDVIFHPNFAEIVKTIDLPEDWGKFYLGCTHEVAPEWIEGRLVRPLKANGSHAFAVHEREYNGLLRFFRRSQVRGADYGLDRILAESQKHIHSYACFPNLAWIPPHRSLKNGKYRGEYLSEGMQKFRVEGLSEIVENIAYSQVYSQDEIDHLGSANKIAFLFLTKGDLNHPDIWSEYFKGYEDRVVIRSHSKYPHQIRSSVLKNTVIDDLVETKWGEVSLVRATRNLLLNALAIKDVKHFILLSESCVPIQPLEVLLRKLEIDPRSRFRFSNYERAMAIQKSRARRIERIPVGCWFFQDQWWLLDRKLALFSVLSDFTHLFENVIASDEMYFGTVLSYQGIPLEGNVVNQAPTWTWWENEAGSPSSWENLESRKHGRGIIENLVNSGAFFARKFPAGADVKKYGLHLREACQSHTNILSK